MFNLRAQCRIRRQRGKNEKKEGRMNAELKGLWLLLSRIIKRRTQVFRKQQHKVPLRFQRILRKKVGMYTSTKLLEAMRQGFQLNGRQKAKKTKNDKEPICIGVAGGTLCVGLHALNAHFIKSNTSQWHRYGSIHTIVFPACTHTKVNSISWCWDARHIKETLFSTERKHKCEDFSGIRHGKVQQY